MDDYMESRRKSKDFGRSLGGKAVIGKSNVSSLNADLSPKYPQGDEERAEQLDRPQKAVQEYALPNSNYHEPREDDSPMKRTDGVPRTPPRPRQQQHQHQHGLPVMPGMLATAPPHLQSLLTRNGSTMESPLLSSLEQQRQIALSLLPGSTHPAPKSATGALLDHQAHAHSFSPQSAYHGGSQYSSQHAITSPTLHPAVSATPSGEPNRLYHGGVGQSSHPYNSLTGSHRRVSPQELPRSALKGRLSNRKDSDLQHNANDDDDPPETDVDHRVLLPGGGTARQAFLDRQKEKDPRLRDTTHGRNFDDRIAQRDADDDEDARDAPEVSFPGHGYAGEQQPLQAGDEPVFREGVLWVNHKGVRQRCLLEASQTLFKGHASIFLLDSRGVALRETPIAVFLLGAVGDLTVTVSGAAMSLQDGKSACLLECGSDVEAEEWAEFLCSSIMANRPLIRRIQHTEAHEPDVAPPSGIAASPRKKGVMFKTDGLADAAAFGSMDMKEAMVVDAYDGDAQDVPREDLSGTIRDMEQKIAANVLSFDQKMAAKEKEMVRECKIMYANEKKKAKSDVAALNKNLASREGISKSQRKIETNKLKLWLEHKLHKLEAINKKRLEATEKQFDEFRHNEYNRLNRINNKLKAKMKVLTQRQEVYKRMRDADCDNFPLPVEKSEDGDTKSGENENGDDSVQVAPEPAEEVPEEPMSKKARLKAKLAAKRLEKEKAAAKEAEEEEEEEATATATAAAAASASASASLAENQPDSERISRKAVLIVDTKKGAKGGGSDAKPEKDAFIALDKKSNVVPSQVLSKENTFNNDDDDFDENDGDKKEKDGIKERPQSPPIPTHQEGGSRFGHRPPKRTDTGKADTENIAPGPAHKLDSLSKHGVSRWHDETEDDIAASTQTSGTAAHLYGGSGGLGPVSAKMLTPVPKVSPAKRAANQVRSPSGNAGVEGKDADEEDGDGASPSGAKHPSSESSTQNRSSPAVGAKMSASGAGRGSTVRSSPGSAHGGRGAPSGGRGRGRGDRRGSALHPSSGISQDEGRDSVQADHDDFDIGPNPNAKPLTGRGMAQKPAVTAPPKNRRGGQLHLDVGKNISEKTYGTGRTVDKFQAGDKRFALSYDSKMNLRNNRDEYCTHMARVLQRFVRATKAKAFADVVMAPLREIRQKNHRMASIIQLAWFGCKARGEFKALIQDAVAKLRHRSVFTMILFMSVFVGKVRLKCRRREKLIQYILVKTTRRRELLLLRRKQEGLQVHKHFNVEPPRKEVIVAVPRGLTSQLQRQAQIEVEQRMRLGGIVNIIKNVSKAGKAAKRFATRVLQLDVDKMDDDPHDLMGHVLKAQAHPTDLRSGYKSSNIGSMSINDVRAAHMREAAVSAFVAIKNKEKQKALSFASQAAIDDEDSEGWDSELD